MKILQCSAEYQSLIKTGGLADMVASLSATLDELGEDIRVCLPAYRGLSTLLQDSEEVARLEVRGQPFRVLSGYMRKGTGPRIYLLDCPELYDRDGDPYRDGKGREFADNWWRYGLFCEATAALAAGGIGGWHPDLLHLHDWHTGLVPAWLQQRGSMLPCLFTIHNFAFQGMYGPREFETLGLPEAWREDELAGSGDGGFSFMKAGLYFSERVSTVSKRYAREIQSAEFGHGLEDRVRTISSKLLGIPNGIDEKAWDPETDRYLPAHYSAATAAEGKRTIKAAVQQSVGLEEAALPLIVFIGRLAEQKGPDLILKLRGKLENLPAQFIILGSGEAELEDAFADWAQAQPGQLVSIARVDEALAHLITAAADIQLLPSRFEPCGLSQMYAQRYGTIPVARETGGLADTITTADDSTLANGSATGILFSDATPQSMMEGIQRALELFGQPEHWRLMQKAAMARDFSWTSSAQHYLELYRSLQQQTRPGSDTGLDRVTAYPSCY